MLKVFIILLCTVQNQLWKQRSDYVLFFFLSSTGAWTRPVKTSPWLTGSPMYQMGSIIKQQMASSFQSSQLKPVKKSDSGEYNRAQIIYTRVIKAFCLSLFLIKDQRIKPCTCCFRVKPIPPCLTTCNEAISSTTNRMSL